MELKLFLMNASCTVEAIIMGKNKRIGEGRCIDLAYDIDNIDEYMVSTFFITSDNKLMILTHMREG